MKDFLLLYLWILFMTSGLTICYAIPPVNGIASSTTSSSPVTTTTTPSLPEDACPCPRGYEGQCTSAEFCVYGINDVGEVFFNGKNDEMDLTNVARMRKEEIAIANFSHANKDDDVIVNLYSPQSVTMAIFYYACQKCDDLKKALPKFTLPKLRIFLLSLYNQRMKHNIRYGQSDFQYYSNPVEDVQLMPEISVRPFWKKRLMFNSSCAQKQFEFTQKHYIPAFLTQDLCMLDYKYNQFLKDTGDFDEYSTKEVEITYSLTLSNVDLYNYDVILNSTNDLLRQNVTYRDRCKVSYYMDENQRFFRYFCLCDNPACTLKVATSYPGVICPSGFGVSFNSTQKFPSIYKTSDFMKVDDFFLKRSNDNRSYSGRCLLAWSIVPPVYNLYIRNGSNLENIDLGYRSDISFYQQHTFCLFYQYTTDQLKPIRSRFFSYKASDLRYTFGNITSDHVSLVNDHQSPVGANCSAEGPFSDPLFSSAYGFNSSAFPCYWYFDITTFDYVYPIMGLNVVPVSILKGKDCYYYTVKVFNWYFRSCSRPSYPIMTIAACPPNANGNQSELNRLKGVLNACPTMKRGDSKWQYQFQSYENGVLCGQFLYGIKKENRKYVPAEIEFRQIYAEDLEMVGMLKKRVIHGCGFNVSQQLTLCTCYAALGECDDLYTAGRVHLFRYLPYSNSTTNKY